MQTPLHHVFLLLFENILPFTSLKEQIHVIGVLNKEIREKLFNNYFLWNLQFDIYFTPLIKFKELFLLNNFEINKREQYLQNLLNGYNKSEYKDKIKLQSEMNFISFYSTLYIYYLVDSYNFCKTTITTPIFNIFKFFYSIFMDRKYSTSYSILFKEKYNLKTLQFLMSILQYTNFPLQFLYCLHKYDGYVTKLDSFVIYLSIYLDTVYNPYSLRIEYDNKNELQVTLKYIKMVNREVIVKKEFKFNYPNDIIEMVKQIDLILIKLFKMKECFLKYFIELPLSFFELKYNYNFDLLFNFNTFYNRKLLYSLNTFSVNYIIRNNFENLVREKVNYLLQNRCVSVIMGNNLTDKLINYLQQYPSENEVQSMLNENNFKNNLFEDKEFENFKLVRLHLLKQYKEDLKQSNKEKYKNKIDIYLQNIIRRYLNLFVLSQPQYSLLFLSSKVFYLKQPSLQKAYKLCKQYKIHSIHKVIYKQLPNLHFMLNLFLLNNVINLVEYRINKFLFTETELKEECYSTTIDTINYEKVTQEIENTFHSLCFHIIPALDK